VIVARYKLDLVSVQKVRWGKGDIVRAVDYIFLRIRKRKSSIRNMFFLYTTEQYQQFKRVEFISSRMSYIVLRGHYSNIVVFHVLAPSEEQSDDSKDKFS
jgi:hypothetical protein